MRCIVTGCAGFIGSHVAKVLLEQEHEVLGIDDFSTGSLKNVDWSGLNNVEHSAIQTFSAFKMVAKFKPDWVFHLAAKPRVQYSVAEPVLTHESNVNGTLNLLEACRLHDVKRVVYSSSSSVYGNQYLLPIKEDVKLNPLSPYALQKLTGETYAKIYYDVYRLPTVSLRYFNVYGARQDPNGDYAAAIPKFVLQILRNKPVTIFGDGEQTRDFTYIHDVVNANLLAAVSPYALGKVFNIGGGENTSVVDLINLIIKELKDINDSPLIQYLDPVVESRHTLADISEAREILKWEPSVSFAEGLKKTVQDMKKEYKND